MAKQRSENSLADKSILLTASSLLSKIVSLASTMIISRMLSENAYGTYKQVFLAFNVVLPFLGFGLTHGLFYYLPFEKKRMRGRLNDCYTVFFASAALFSLFILFGGNVLLANRFTNPDIAPLMIWAIPYMILTVMTQCNLVVFNVMNRVRLYMIYSVCSGIVTSAAMIAAILISPTAKSVVLASVLTKTAEGIVLMLLTNQVLPKDSGRPDFGAIKEILKFSIPMGIAGMVSNLSVQLDSLFVSSMKTPEEFAVYTVGAHELILIGVITSAISSAVTPAMRVSVAEGHLDKCSGLFQLCARRMASMLVPMMCFFWVWSEDFLTFVYSDKYIGAVWIFRVYLLYFLLRISVTGQVFSSLGMGRYILIRSIATCVLNAALNYFGIMLFGSIGAAIATVLSGWLVFIFSIAPMLRKKLGMRLRDTYPTATVAGSLLLGMACAYGVELLLCRPFLPRLIEAVNVPKIVGWIGLSQKQDLVETLESAIGLAAECVLFMAVYIPLAVLIMKNDYKWMITKTKEIFSRIFRRRNSASDTII